MVEKLKTKVQDIRARSMIRAEWRHLAGDKLLIITLAVLAFIPIMYGGFFLGGIWDPYGNTKNLMVAVVNQDEGAEIANEHQNIGDKTIENLKENHDLDWQFVTQKEAEKCLDDNKCYASVTIPKDFSKKAATITEANPSTSHLNYTLTPSRNYIGALITEQAAIKIEQTVSENLSKAYVSALLGSVDELGSGLEQAGDGAEKLQNGAHDLEQGLVRYTGGVGSLQSGQASLQTGLGQLQAGSSSLRGGLEQVNSSLPSPTQIDQLNTGVKQIQNGVSALNQAVQTPSIEMINLQTNLKNHSSDLAQKLQNYQASAANASGALTAIGTSVQTAAATNQATVSLNTADMVKLLDLTKQSQSIAQGSAQVLADLAQFSARLEDQQTSLKTNVAQLNIGVNQFTPSAVQAFSGYNSLRSGNQQLVSGATKLENGLMSATGGSNQLLGGINQLSSNSWQLINGAGQIGAGAGELASKLHSASSQVSLQPTGEKTADHIISPVSLKKSERGNVPNYGYALAPYVLSLGLFVGALVFNVIYPIRRTFGPQDNPLKWWAAKASVGMAVAIMQALVLDMIMIWGLGLHPDNLAQFVGTSILTSITYMSIVMLLAISMDNIGRFLAMILLVLQLGGAGGTFPIQTAPAFFQAINPYLPMTYSVYAFRESISSGLGSQLFAQSTWILVAFAVVANLCLIAFLWRHGTKAFKHVSVDG